MTSYQFEITEQFVITIESNTEADAKEQLAFITWHGVVPELIDGGYKLYFDCLWYPKHRDGYIRAKGWIVAYGNADAHDKLRRAFRKAVKIGNVSIHDTSRIV